MSNEIIEFNEEDVENVLEASFPVLFCIEPFSDTIDGKSEDYWLALPQPYPAGDRLMTEICNRWNHAFTDKKFRSPASIMTTFMDCVLEQNDIDASA